MSSLSGDTRCSSTVQGYRDFWESAPRLQLLKTKPFPVKDHISVAAELVITSSLFLLWSCVAGFSFQLLTKRCFVRADTQRRPYKKAAGSQVCNKCSYGFETMFCISPLLQCSSRLSETALSVVFWEVFPLEQLSCSCSFKAHRNPQPKGMIEPVWEIYGHPLYVLRERIRPSTILG